jgi:hypothetical protein
VEQTNKRAHEHKKSDVYNYDMRPTLSLFVWLVADGWCWFVLREKYYWLVAGG